ncbi:hypothetical protein LDENG_00152030 [Lucifuga dentata]|nr:hypothetical protein LDENG_00152030 [Lucifuga dentata]
MCGAVCILDTSNPSTNSDEQKNGGWVLKEKTGRADITDTITSSLLQTDTQTGVTLLTVPSPTNVTK